MGIYDEDDCQGVHPDVIHQYYGTTRARVRQRVGQTGAGHPPEEYDDNDSGNDNNDGNDDTGDDDGGGNDNLTPPLPSLVGEVIQDQDPNIRHDAIPTPDRKAPVTTPENLALFSESITILQSDKALLRSITGQAITWDPVEAINVGHRRRKELVVSVEGAAWEQRALLWIAALRLLDNLV
jgi:hypothetical protein